MEEELKQFFASNDFYRMFEVRVLWPGDDEHQLICYSRKIGWREYKLIFSDRNGLKGFHLRVDRRTYVGLMYYRNIEELSLFLNRLPELRWRNPLCSDSELREA